ncbi:MAG: hypothetical protein Kow0075_10660 [Salibacteraceae bacterium]
MALARESNAAMWQNAAAYTRKLIEYYSQTIGAYEYPKMIVADARDGMEYPMLTLDGGGDPGYRSLFAHEIAHNWFFGMVGNNETYRALLDEGFTQYYTYRAMDTLEGRSPYWGSDLDAYDAYVYQGYAYILLHHGLDAVLTTHSDHFDYPFQYGLVYFKTAVMLGALNQILGDSLFDATMRLYFDKWKFCHPYTEDFRSTVISFVGADLNWFFDQWLNTTHHVDYKLKGTRQKDGKLHLKIKRKGYSEAPLLIKVQYEDSSEYTAWIPNRHIDLPEADTILPLWYGWNRKNTLYEIGLAGRENPSRIVIDPDNRSGDLNRFNNEYPRRIHLELDDLRDAYFSGFKYTAKWRPDLWYNGYDGIKAGLVLNTGYENIWHQFKGGVWFSTGLFQRPELIRDQADINAYQRIQYSAEYAHQLGHHTQKMKLMVGSKYFEGLVNQSLMVQKQSKDDRFTIEYSIGSLYRPTDASLNYLLYPDQWSYRSWNNFTEIRFRASLGGDILKRKKVDLTIRSPFLWSDFSYGFARIRAAASVPVSRVVGRFRWFAQMGIGNRWPLESQLYAAGASPEELMENPFTRSVGFAMPLGYGAETGHFQASGGLNLRGYNNYLMPEVNSDGATTLAFLGTTGTAVNTEIEFDDLLKIKTGLEKYTELKTYLFADAGLVNANRINQSLAFGSLRADAGFGAALEIHNWFGFDGVKPVTLRVDFPVFLNRPPAGEEFLQFRWLFGFDRVF